MSELLDRWQRAPYRSGTGRAATLIEEAILRKEIKVVDGAFGVAYVNGGFFLTDDCSCPIGIFLVSDASPEHRHRHCSDVVCAAANLLGVRKEWVAGFIVGFDQDAKSGFDPGRIVSQTSFKEGCLEIIL
jgi:hypothetical protein